MFPKIAKFRRIGKGGEHEIASVLGNFSNIASPEYDVGFDYFCELFENNHPSGKCFWVQAKTTEKFKEEWIKYVDKKVIRIWLTQFFPVFIIVHEKCSDRIFWSSVEDYRKEWESKLGDKNKTIKVVVNRSQILKKNDENLEFKKVVNRDIVLANAVHGVPHMIGKKGYIRSIPVLRLSETARKNVRHRIRLGLNYLMADSWIKSNIQEAYDLGKLLAAFDKDHYDHFVVLARLCHTLGLDDEAIENYDFAIEVCKRDKKWNKLKKPTDASIEEIIEAIKKEKEKLKQK